MRSSTCSRRPAWSTSNSTRSAHHSSWPPKSPAERFGLRSRLANTEEPDYRRACLVLQDPRITTSNRLRGELEHHRLTAPLRHLRAFDLEQPEFTVPADGQRKARLNSFDGYLLEVVVRAHTPTLGPAGPEFRRGTPVLANIQEIFRNTTEFTMVTRATGGLSVR